jgi:hypothetical protein
MKLNVIIKQQKRFDGTWQTEKYMVWKMDGKPATIIKFGFCFVLFTHEPKTNGEISQSSVFPLSFVNLMNEYCS